MNDADEEGCIANTSLLVSIIHSLTKKERPGDVTRGVIGWRFAVFGHFYFRFSVFGHFYFRFSVFGRFYFRFAVSKNDAVCGFWPISYSVYGFYPILNAVGGFWSY